MVTFVILIAKTYPDGLIQKIEKQIIEKILKISDI